MERKLTVFAFVVWIMIGFEAKGQVVGDGGNGGNRYRLMDGIAAVVNGEVITISQLRELTMARELALREMMSGEELKREVERIRKQALQDLIDRQLILQEFRRREFTLPEYVVEDRINQIIREEFGGDRQTFLRTILAQGYTLSRFREVEREKLIVQAMRQANVKDDFVVTPQQVREYYVKNRRQFSEEEEIRLRMIVFRGGKEGGELPTLEGGDKKKLAEEVRAKIIGGADFVQMAQMYSEDETTAEAGGDWGWIGRETLAEPLAKVAFGLKTGEVSPVVSFGGSYYLLLVEERKNARVKPLEEVQKDIERTLLFEHRRRAQERWLEGLRRKAYIQIFV
ncbi:MAG: peptidyl-prolyl cis-trans isomerase [Chthoniobacterales bacterium]|nr:peptidyl-prolyl cis-trans isomerase [Chthoniobacterales bacterium]